MADGNKKLFSFCFLYTILFGIGFISCTSIEVHREVSESSEILDEEYEIYNFLAGEIQGFNEIKIKGNNYNAREPDLTEEEINALIRAASESGEEVNAELRLLIIGDYTTLPSFNKHLPFDENYDQIRVNLLAAFGSEYQDVVNDFIEKNALDYKLAAYFDNAGRNIISEAEYNKRKEAYNPDSSEENAGKSFAIIYSGPLVVSRIGLNETKTIALAEYEFKSRIDYVLLEKTETWKIIKIINRRISESY
jgi:uncharacterized membrane protein YkoI